MCTLPHNHARAGPILSCFTLLTAFQHVCLEYTRAQLSHARVHVTTVPDSNSHAAHGNARGHGAYAMPWNQGELACYYEMTPDEDASKRGTCAIDTHQHEPYTTWQATRTRHLHETNISMLAHACTHTCTRTLPYIRTRTHTRTHTHSRTHTHTHTHKYIHTRARTTLSVHAHTRTHGHTDTPCCTRRFYTRPCAHIAYPATHAASVQV